MGSFAILWKGLQEPIKLVLTRKGHTRNGQQHEAALTRLHLTDQKTQTLEQWHSQITNTA